MVHNPSGCAAAAALVALAACASPEHDRMKIENLVGTWRLADVPVPAGARIPTLTFAADGSVSGNSGVNQFRGALDLEQLAAGRFQLGPLAGTLMAGPPEAMALESSYLQALQAADSIERHGDMLRLRRGEQVLLVLEPLRIR